jgi:DnaJ-class molecular chaperone
MTPYATLLLRPSDSDDTVRARFHALSKHEHPDRPGAGGVPGTFWYVLTDAYASVKTAELRAGWERAQRSLSGLCPECDGFGVQGSRVAGGKIRVCDACEGQGRLYSTSVKRGSWFTKPSARRRNANTRG